MLSVECFRLGQRIHAERFSLTLALSRWEREQPSYVGIFPTRVLPAPTQVTLFIGRRFSLSQRERAGVRENGPASNPRALIPGPGFDCFRRSRRKFRQRVFHFEDSTSQGFCGTKNKSSV